MLILAMENCVWKAKAEKGATLFVENKPGSKISICSEGKESLHQFTPRSPREYQGFLLLSQEGNGSRVVAWGSTAVFQIKSYKAP